eukprot:8743933-Pyramimonas_sp.AAC.1
MVAPTLAGFLYETYGSRQGFAAPFYLGTALVGGILAYAYIVVPKPDEADEVPTIASTPPELALRARH